MLTSHLVVVPVTVSTVDGDFVKGLGVNHFELYDEKVKQEIAFFSRDEQPVSVGIILDFSGSMDNEKIETARRAIHEFVQWSNPEDEFFLIGFNEHVRLLRDFTSSADDIASSVVFTGAAGKTAVYDAVHMGMEKVMYGRYPRRALVLISDGEDNSSRYTQKQLKNLIKESDVLIYTIGIFGAWEAPMDISYGWQVLKELTEVTGGRSFSITAQQDEFTLSTERFNLPDQGKEGLTTICQQVAIELKSQYTLGFYPTEAKKNDKGDHWRHLKVRLKPMKGIGPLSIRARKGYTQ